MEAVFCYGHGSGDPITTYIIITDYQQVLQTELFQLSPNLLVVSQSNGFGEVYGSRLSPEIGELLKSKGVSWVLARN